LFAQRRLKNNLLWDYQSILARDPRLPLDLLPSDWGGTAAKAFIERCGATLFAEIAQFQG
jgi:DNA-binding transcriptional regulator PaaX